MHDQAIEARTRLQLERETERQSQELRDSKQENRLHRAARHREEQAREVEHEVALQRTRLTSDLEARQVRIAFRREQARLNAEQTHALAAQDDARRRDHLAALRAMGVDLTAYLTRGRADRVIEVRGANGATHVHVEPDDPVAG
jgi:hypothetical protein